LAACFLRAARFSFLRSSLSLMFFVFMPSFSYLAVCGFLLRKFVVTNHQAHRARKTFLLAPVVPQCSLS
jgi:hypothetical protein